MESGFCCSDMQVISIWVLTFENAIDMSCFWYLNDIYIQIRNHCLRFSTIHGWFRPMVIGAGLILKLTVKLLKAESRQ